MGDERSLVLVEDDATFVAVLARSLGRRGYQVRTAADRGELEMLLVDTPFRYAIVDLNLNSASGPPCIDALRRADATTTVVVLTGFASPATAGEAVRLGACCGLPKPSNSDDIEAAFASAGQSAKFERLAIGSNLHTDLCELG